LDVTKLSEKQVKQVIKGLVDEAQDFNLCKLVQVTGFNKENKRYLAVSGESHAMWQGSTKNEMLDSIRSVTGELPVEYVKSYIKPPTQGEPYQTTNLGPYGSTGSPGLGISQHPDAQKLRNQGKIR